jgi:hypothetical protein
MRGNVPAWLAVSRGKENTKDTDYKGIKMSKIKKLAEIEGMTAMEMFEEATFDSVAKGICINPGCDYTIEVEPDCRSGWCENCHTNTVRSCLVLAGMI